jgi:hypothetical protein
MKQPPELEPLFRSGLSFFAERRQGLTYQHLQLGMPGWWGGVGIAALELTNPVDFQEVDRVFHSGIHDPSASTEAAKNPVVGTLLNFEADPQISGIWALGDPQTKSSVLTLHQHAVDRAMGELQDLAKSADFRPHNTHPPGFLYVAFTRGANDTLQPNLRTTVLLSSRFELPDGQVIENPLSLRHGAALGRFKRWEAQLFEESIGPLGVHADAQLPMGLFRAASRGVQTQLLLRVSQDPEEVSRHIQRQWRVDAAEQGFGNGRIQGLLTALHKHRELRIEQGRRSDPRQEEFWKGILFPEKRPEHPRSHEHGMGSL